MTALTTGPLRLLIADDHPIAVAGIRLALEAAGGFAILDVAGDGAEALAKVEALRPDIVVTDLALPRTSGVEVIVETRRRAPATRLFALTGIAEARLLRHAAEAGAFGIALKSEEPGVWIGLLRRAHQPGKQISPMVRKLMAEAGPAAVLTLREREVLLGIARGETNAQMAARLGIGVRTVDKHRSTLMRKVGAHGIADLLRVALREGLLHSLGHS